MNNWFMPVQGPSNPGDAPQVSRNYRIDLPDGLTVRTSHFDSGISALLLADRYGNNKLKIVAATPRLVYNAPSDRERSLVGVNSAKFVLRAEGLKSLAGDEFTLDTTMRVTSKPSSEKGGGYCDDVTYRMSTGFATVAAGVVPVWRARLIARAARSAVEELGKSIQAEIALGAEERHGNIALLEDRPVAGIGQVAYYRYDHDNGGQVSDNPEAAGASIPRPFSSIHGYSQPAQAEAPHERAVT